MQKVRIYQLAKELKVQSALILELLDRLGREVKSDLSVLDSGTADLVRERVTVALKVEREKLAEEAEQMKAEQEEAERAAAEKVDEAAAAAAATPVAEIDTVVEEEPAEPIAEERAPVAPAPPAAPLEPAPAASPPAEPAAPLAATPATKPQAPAVPGPPGARKPRVFPARRVPPPSMLTRSKPAAPHTPPASRGGMPPGRPGFPPARPGMPGRPAQSFKKRKKRDKKDREAVPVLTRPRPDLPPVPETVTLSEGVTVKELAEKLNRRSKDVIAKLIGSGVLATINQPLDPDVAIKLAKDFGCTATVITFEEEAQRETRDDGPEVPVDTDEKPEDRRPRPPVVTVMGHVDHGKTSLLDAIRATEVADAEAGGITQHIGAYQVEENGRKITFLDTPGHEAFTLMRARGAKATDIVVLVVAADDGVKPQTLEAIDHAKAADVPLIVAINKIDKPNADPDRVKQQLAEHELLVESYGGSIVSCEVSAKKRIGLEELLEMVLLVADMKDLTANPDKLATGVVLEARRDRARGVLATVLVQSGTLRVGDPFIAGSSHGKVRAMTDQHGRRIEAAGPSTPVEVMGYAEEPGAGDPFQSIGDEAKARQIASFRQEKLRAEKHRASSRRTLESLAKDIARGTVKELPVLLKADVQGSVEAIRHALAELPSDKVRVEVLRASIGAITQADVLLATTSDSIVIGFNVRADAAAVDLAKREQVEIRYYTVIYDLIDEVKQAMVGLLEPTFKETVLGQAEVRELFKVPKIGMIAGCYVKDGKVARNGEVRLLRDNVVIHSGKIGSLKRFKDDASEVKQGYECGIGIAGYNDLKQGDVIECFIMERVVAKSL